MKTVGFKERARAGRMTSTRSVMRALVVAGFVVAWGCTPAPKSYGPPGKTTWAPEGCRSVPSDNPILGLPATFSRTFHVDTMNSDEVSIALAPVFEYEWVAEPQFYIPEGPSFDRDGNLYFTPLLPGEDVILVSLDPDTGARRWAVNGTTLNGAGAPLVLDDPLNPGEQIIYVGVYDRALAIRPNGTVLWDVSTGLPTPPPPGVDIEAGYHCFGLNYHAQADAIIGVMHDGNLYALDRTTGAQLLAAPYVIPGEPSPPRESLILPEDVTRKANDAMRPLLGALPPEANPLDLITNIVLGYESKVANYFAVDAHTGRIWVAATAPDGEDGIVDGVSEFGALYCLELVTAGGLPYTIHELFHTSFSGGTASTPTLRSDGTRIYMGDNLGHLIAIDSSDGAQIWQLDVGRQIFGSVAVASDNNEMYACTSDAVIKVIDNGASGTEAWRSLLDAYIPGVGQKNFNVLLATIGANGVIIQTGAGPELNDYPLPLRVGIGLLDRETGHLRYFAEGREESIAAMNSGPDGAVYLGHSPLRRAVSRALYGDIGWTQPLTGGVGKFGAGRLDLLIRDAVCAASARASNAFQHAGTCVASAEADVRQIRNLIDQCRRSSIKAIADGDLTAGDWAALDGYLTAAEASLAVATLDIAGSPLQQACDFFPQ
jgi:outer membrane protein assembly factor BamB